MAVLMLVACHHGAHCADASENPAPKNVLASTFPVWLFTQAVCAGVPGISVNLLLPSAAGCPHDFALRPGDMQKLARADIFIINGAGLEDFLNKPLSALDRQPEVINAGENVPLLEESAAHQHNHDHDHAHGAVNPHIFAAPDTAAMMVANIADGMVRLDPANASAYRKNAAAYATALGDLSSALKRIGDRAKNRQIALEHEALAYLAANANLEIVDIFENGLSAAALGSLISALKAEQPVVLAGDAQFPGKLLATLSDETGIPAISLDPCASGPENATPDYYIKAMNKNISALEIHFDRK